ncbi:MAG: bifunctional oligoribonuclease/PAP phosphatase NrnA [Treponema sp.]|nr:bifunctional oligoribonuclease/PAP phosphatase NrnA [Candidatus Treponema caballi]
MKLLTQEQITAFKKFIDSHNSFIVAGHKEPDGDCVASSLGIARLLKAFGKNYCILNAGPFKRTEIRPYEKYFTSVLPKSFQKAEDAAVIIVDCSELSRLGDADPIITRLDTYILDHHKTAECSGNAIVDPTSPAAACIVQQLYEALVGPLDKETADILFFGLSTDTGFFRFLDTNSAEVFMAASRLVAAGANPRSTYDEITGGKPWSTRKLLGTMLDKAERYYGGKLIITTENLEDTRRMGSEGRDSDSLYQLLLAVEGVEAVVFVREETDKTCTLGFRSRNEVDVSSIASVFGGGGHKNASGALTEGTPGSLIPKIKEEFCKFFK